MKRISFLMVTSVNMTEEISLYYGHVFSQSGIVLCPKTIEAIKSLLPPRNSLELQSFLGVATYCNRFINDMAPISAVLRQLIKKTHNLFQLQGIHQRAFEKLQQNLTHDTVMSHFDLEKETDVIVGASPT